MNRLRSPLAAASNMRRGTRFALSAGLALLVSLVALAAVVWSQRERSGATGGEESVDVRAFLSGELSDDDAGDLLDEVRMWDGVEDVVFFTKADALTEARELFADEPQVLQLIEADPSVLPASLQITIASKDDTDAVVARLRAKPGVIDVVIDTADATRQVVGS